MTEIIAFGLSRQPHCSSEWEGKQTRGFSEQKAASVSKRKLTDWPSIVINIQGSSGVIRMGACVEAPGTFSPDCSESLTPGAYTSGGILSSIVVLYSLDRESREV